MIEITISIDEQRKEGRAHGEDVDVRSLGVGVPVLTTCRLEGTLGYGDSLRLECVDPAGYSSRTQ